MFWFGVLGGDQAVGLITIYYTMELVWMQE